MLFRLYRQSLGFFLKPRRVRPESLHFPARYRTVFTREWRALSWPICHNATCTLSRPLMCYLNPISSVSFRWYTRRTCTHRFALFTVQHVLHFLESENGVFDAVEQRAFPADGSGYRRLILEDGRFVGIGLEQGIHSIHLRTNNSEQWAAVDWHYRKLRP